MSQIVSLESHHSSEFYPEVEPVNLVDTVFVKVDALVTAEKLKIPIAMNGKTICKR